MTPQPTAGEIVAITTTDSDPFMLVCHVDDHVTGVLLADLATETIHRLRTSDYDTATRRELATAVERADECMSFTVPTTDCALIERDSSHPGPFTGGED